MKRNIFIVTASLAIITATAWATAQYPAAIKSWTALVANVDYPKVTHINTIYDEVTAIETELGINPSGGAATVGDRFTATETVANAALPATGSATGATSSAQAFTSGVKIGGAAAYAPLAIRATNAGAYAEGINLDINDATQYSAIGIDFNTSDVDLGSVPGARIQAVRTNTGASTDLVMSTRGAGPSLNEVMRLYSTGGSKFSWSGGPAVISSRTTTGTNEVTSSVRAQLTTSGDMSDGFGPAYFFYIKDSAGVENPIAYIAGYRDGADNSGAISLKPHSAGSAISGGLTVKSSGNVGIGTATPASTLHVDGSEQHKTTVVTANTTLGSTHHTVIVCSPATTEKTITLPSPSAALVGREYMVFNYTTGVNSVFVSGVLGGGSIELVSAYPSKGVRVVCTEIISFGGSSTYEWFPILLN